MGRQFPGPVPVEPYTLSDIFHSANHISSNTEFRSENNIHSHSGICHYHLSETSAI